MTVEIRLTDHSRILAQPGKVKVTKDGACLLFEREGMELKVSIEELRKTIKALEHSE